MPIDINELIDTMFPTLKSMTYLNNASTGIPPVTMVNAVKEYLENMTNAIGSMKDTLSLIKEIRQLLASVLGGDYSQYGLVPSTSQGINSFAHSVDYPEGSNIVLCDLEFPANYVPWQNVCRFNNVELKVVKSENGAVSIDQFMEQIDEKTKVVTISHVQFGSGFRTNLRKLAGAIHEVGGYLFSDIIQAAGWADLNLVQENVDFASGQSAKWLLGPIGAGYVYVKEEILHELKPRFLGWWGVKELTEFGYSQKEPFEDARKFQVGSPPMMAYVGVRESLKIMQEVPSAIREKLALKNADYLRRRLSEIDFEFYDFGEEHKSPIVSCKPPDVEELHQRLLEKKIYVSVRNGRLRVSPHFYNTPKDIDTLVENLR